MGTMADVAAEAGVSVSTVSHVLNRTRPVSERLTALVLAAVTTTGYSPNAVARSLATSTTRLIGVVMSATSNPFFAPLFSAMEETARRHGYTVLLTDSQDDPTLEATQVRVLLDHRVAGLVLAPATDDPTSVLDLLFDTATPTVLVDRFADDRFDQIGVENLHATAHLVTHLAQLGHTRIAFVGGRRGLTTTVERLAGYRLGLEMSGLRFDARLVRSGTSRADPARIAVRRLLSGPDAPTAIVSANNDMTLGVLRAARDASVRVPADIAVVGYDDVAWADLVDPGLTVVAQPVVEIGQRAMKMLLGRMDDPGRPARLERIEPRFVHRGSCGCHPAPTVALRKVTAAAGPGPSAGCPQLGGPAA